jgi:hypothetical protein
MKYWAFISYSHKDRRAAERLHRAIEGYRVPARLVGKPGVGGEEMPRRLVPIFIDRAELASSPSLAETIRSALNDSRFLIVLCSPSARASSYVEAEILEFRRLGRKAQILAAIADPGPRHAVGDVFPRPLCGDDEPLAADFEKDGFDNAKLKLVAGILGIGFDKLKDRDRKRARWRRFAGALCAFLFLLCYAGAVDAGAPFLLGDSLRRMIDQHELSIFRHAPSQATLNATAANLRKVIVPEAVSDMEAPDLLSFTPDGHEGGTWDLGQFVSAIAAAPEATQDDLNRAQSMIDDMFLPGRPSEADGIDFGWLHFELTNPQAEASLWPIIGLSSLLERSGYLNSQQRQTTVAHLHYAERAANLYFFPNGGWDQLPRQQPPQPYAVYTTLTGLDAMLSVRAAGQTWPDAQGTDQLAQMISATVNYLLSTYDRSDEWRDNPGWHGTSEDNQVTPNQSLTLLSYTLLLQASIPEQEHSPVWQLMLTDMGARIGKLHLQEFATDEDILRANYIGPDGKEHEAVYQWKLERLPWAISFANAWISHLEQSHAPTADLVAARRVLKTLIGDAGPVGQERQDFYRAELLFRLDGVK